MTMPVFQAQLNTMVMWFDQWNESGQTVALFKMLTRLAPTQARFVSIALEHSLTECAELALREQEANNPGFVSGLLCESKEVAMAQTLLHLPLLRPGNAEARHIYLTLVPALLTYSMESGMLLEEARQLLSYALIHPALRDDRRIFEPWRRSLGERIMSGSKNPAVIIGTDQQQKTRRSNSLTPPFAVTPNTEWSSQDDLSVHGKTRRFSLSSDHSIGPPLSPQSSQASSGSGSETHLDMSGFDSPEMRDIKCWLKSLRLHKYWRLFCQLTYEQVLNLTEENFDATLEQINGCPVTQGARRKIILSIMKLRERSSLLSALEQDVISGGNLMTALDELKQVLATPIKAYPEDEVVNYDDIPSQFTRVLGKVCTQLMVGNSSDEETLSVFLGLLDSCLHHEAFTAQQKKKITSWRLQISQQIRQIRIESGRLVPQVMFLQASPPHRQVLTPPSPTTQQQYHQQPGQLLPLEHNQAESFQSPRIIDAQGETEINSRLESLCLSMTEHALGGTSDL